MKHKIVVRPQARAELAEATSWYRSRSEIVATGFALAIRQMIARISERPKSFVEVVPSVRRALTPQFPYAIFFAEDSAVIVILAIKHQAQDPAEWPSGA